MKTHRRKRKATRQALCSQCQEPFTARLTARGTYVRTCSAPCRIRALIGMRGVINAQIAQLRESEQTKGTP